MKQCRLTIAVCSLFLTPLAGSAQAQAPKTSLLANPVFQENCAKCHGKTAEGRHFAGPSLVSQKTTGVSADELRNVIANGKGHLPSHMPKFEGKLTPEEIDVLVRQIQAAHDETKGR